jgi:hypothetical protein
MCEASPLSVREAEIVLFILEVAGSILNSDTSYTEAFHGICGSLKIIVGITPQLRNHRFIPDPYKFIIH